MSESARRHERIPQSALPGERWEINGLLARPVQIFLPEAARGAGRVSLLMHFHGSAFVAERAVTEQPSPYIVATVNLGAGSSVYERAFTDPLVLQALRDTIAAQLGQRGLQLGRTVLSGFSAGCGAIRAILREETLVKLVDAVLLIDGVHTSYVPEGRVLAEGGQLDTTRIESLRRFGQLALDGQKRMLVTHSEIFPGTYASTTETADYFVRALGLRRTPVLEWGPVGMQRLSVAARGGLRIEGFAGNTAPDHIDHYHGLPHFLKAIQ